MKEVETIKLNGNDRNVKYKNKHTYTYIYSRILRTTAIFYKYVNNKSLEKITQNHKKKLN